MRRESEQNSPSATEGNSPLAKTRRGKTASAEERLAKAILEAAIPGARLEYQEEQSSLRHDFDVFMPDGLVIPLEVTSSVDFVLRRTNAALESKGGFVPRSHCRKDWVVFPGRTSRINKVRERVDFMLSAVENEGIEEFFSPAQAGDSRAVFAIYSELGIEFGSQRALRRPGILICSASGDAVEVNAASVQEAVTVEAAKKDNRMKLGAIVAKERHLFVLVSGENQKPWFGLVDCDPPAVAPDLPAEITHVWAAARSRGRDEYVVWRGNADGWTNVGPFVVEQRAVRL